MQKTWVQYLAQEEPLEKEMATHFSIPAWRIPWTEESAGLQSVGSRLSDFHFIYQHMAWHKSGGGGPEMASNSAMFASDDIDPQM